MMRRPRSHLDRPAAVAVAGLAAVMLAGCQAGLTAQTSQWYNPTDGRNVNVPASPGYNEPYLAVRGVVIVRTTSGQGVLVGKVINKTTTDEALLAATVGSASAQLPSGGVAIPPGGTASFGATDGPVAVWSTLPVPVGRWTELTLSFQTAGQVKVSVLVVPNAREYAGVPTTTRSAQASPATS